MQEGVASWYDDAGSLVCERAASGLGVANLTLPCGTPVRICYAGCVTATVDDRGPYIAGRVLDLDAAAKSAINCTDLCDVRWGVVR